LWISPTDSAAATYDQRMRRSIFTEDHELFRQSVRTFIEREVTPNFERWDRDGIVDRELFTAAGAAGFLAIDAPEKFGGGGVEDFSYNAIISEEFAYAGAAPAGIGITLHNDICLPYFLSHQCRPQHSETATTTS
jgi:alkylation response protein AidB-like acyl-CoA dehydrogenase